MEDRRERQSSYLLAPKLTLAKLLLCCQYKGIKLPILIWRFHMWIFTTSRIHLWTSSRINISGSVNSQNGLQKSYDRWTYQTVCWDHDMCRDPPWGIPLLTPWVRWPSWRDISEFPSVPASPSRLTSPQSIQTPGQAQGPAWLEYFKHLAYSLSHVTLPKAPWGGRSRILPLPVKDIIFP